MPNFLKYFTNYYIICNVYKYIFQSFGDPRDKYNVSYSHNSFWLTQNRDLQMTLSTEQCLWMKGCIFPCLGLIAVGIWMRIVPIDSCILTRIPMFVWLFGKGYVTVRRFRLAEGSKSLGRALGVCTLTALPVPLSASCLCLNMWSFSFLHWSPTTMPTPPLWTLQSEL